MRINPHQLAITIPVAVASAQPARLDVTQNRARIAANCVVLRRHCCPQLALPESPPEFDRESPARAGCALP